MKTWVFIIYKIQFEKKSEISMTAFGFACFYPTIIMPDVYVLMCMIMHRVIAHYKTLP